MMADSRTSEKLTADGGITKMLLHRPSDAEVELWLPGSNAKVAFTASVYTLGDVALPKSDGKHERGHHHHEETPQEKQQRMREKMAMMNRVLGGKMFASVPTKAPKKKKERAAGKASDTILPNSDAHRGHESHPLGTNGGTAHAEKEEQKPEVRKVKICSSWEMNPSEPFALRIGKQFSFQALETAVKTMRIGEKARFLCMPEHGHVRQARHAPSMLTHSRHSLPLQPLYAMRSRSGRSRGRLCRSRDARRRFSLWTVVAEVMERTETRT